MQPTTLVATVAQLSIAGMERSRRELLGFRTGEGEHGEFRKQSFGDGRARDGVPLVLSPKAWRRIAFVWVRNRHERYGWL